MGLAVYSFNKKIVLYNESEIPAVYKFLPSVDMVTSELDPSVGFDTAVILDCSNIDRVGRMAEVINKIPLVINVDHHTTNTRFGGLRLVDTTACSTSELVYRLIKQMRIPISKDMAYALYTGILTDTGSFRFSSTNRAAFKICGSMVERGVVPDKVSRHVYGTFSMGRIKLLNMALNSIEISKNKKLSVMTLSKKMFTETGAGDDEAAGFINYAKAIEHVKVAVVIHENTNGSPEPRCSISLRSDGTVDVASIAKTFGGGGHFSAAGFSDNRSLEELKTRIFEIAGVL